MNLFGCFIKNYFIFSRNDILFHVGNNIIPRKVKGRLQYEQFNVKDSDVSLVEEPVHTFSFRNKQSVIQQFND